MVCIYVSQKCVGTLEKEEIILVTRAYHCDTEKTKKTRKKRPTQIAAVLSAHAAHADSLQFFEEREK